MILPDLKQGLKVPGDVKECENYSIPLQFTITYLKSTRASVIPSLLYTVDWAILCILGENCPRIVLAQIL